MGKENFSSNLVNARTRATETKVWRSDSDKFWSYGQTFPIPKGYDSLFLGDRSKTMHVKQNADAVFIEMEKCGKRFSRPVAIWAPRAVIQEANALKPRSTEEQRARNKELRQIRIRAKARKQIQALFPLIPDLDLDQIVERAYEIGSGRVGLTGTLTPEEAAERAVIAHVRHRYTDYELLLLSAYDDEDDKEEIRLEARRSVSHSIYSVLDNWRGRVRHTESDWFDEIDEFDEVAS